MDRKLPDAGADRYSDTRRARRAAYHDPVLLCNVHICSPVDDASVFQPAMSGMLPMVAPPLIMSFNNITRKTIAQTRVKDGN